MLATLTLVLFPGALAAQDAASSPEKFHFAGDFRLRLETDWDSQNAGGEKRDDRARMRVRARLLFEYKPKEAWAFGVRLRSGSDLSQQSPHITILDFDDNDTGAAAFNLDRWYLKARKGSFWAWGGRNVVPFWRQNELLWDDDATPVGVAAGWTAALGRPKLRLTAGYFSMPAGMRAFTGTLGAGQLALVDPRFTLAAGFYRFDANPDDPDADLLLTGNGKRDYSILQVSGQAAFDRGWAALSFGFDFHRNLEDYSPDDPDPFTAAHFDQRDAWVVSATLRLPSPEGQPAGHGVWQAAYRYAHIEALGVNASYAQDDWVRWGSAGQTRSSDLEGHELLLSYAFSPSVRLRARLWLVDSITTVEDGNRLRIDLDYRF